MFQSAQESRGYINFIGFILIFLVHIIFLLAILIENRFSTSFIIYSAVSLLLLVFGYRLVLYDFSLLKETILHNSSHSYTVILFSTAGALLTFFFSISLSLGPVIGSSLVGIISTVFFYLVSPKFSIPESEWRSLSAVTYCGSFAGMSSLERIENYWFVALSGILCGVIFLLMDF